MGFGLPLSQAIFQLRMAALGVVFVPPVAALLSVSSATGCAPSCADEPVFEKRGFLATKDASGRLVPLEMPELSFATCRELCENAPAALDFDSCDVASKPSFASSSSPSSSSSSSSSSAPDAGDAVARFTVSCSGTWAQCKNNYTLGSGRRPEGYPSTPLHSILHEMARLEAASAIAFARIAGELVVHGAPSSLVEQALAAIDDETRHARLVLALADSICRRPPPLQEDAPLDARFDLAAHCPTAPRALLDMALENAREGVINETFGALLNHYQAAHAPDPNVRALFAQLANDEINHAALSLRIHQWAIRRLPSNDDVARVHYEMQHALDELRAHCAPHPERGALLGQPPRPTQLAILDTLDDEVLSLCA